MGSQKMVQVFLLLIFVFLSLGFNKAEPQPTFPLQFTANVKLTAHMIDEDSAYPPRVRTLKIYYDYLQKRARADIDGGYEAAKTYIRLYNSKNEYMIREPPINDCKRAHLGELMPFPDIPNTKFVNSVEVDDVMCDHFVHEDYNTIVHVYIDAKSGAPVRLVHASTSTSDEETYPLLTYDYSDVILGPPLDQVFVLPKPFSHSDCDRHVGGFPYLHIFHHFVKF